MPPISNSLRAVIQLVTIIATFASAFLLFPLESNIKYAIRKKGRPPSAKPRKLWASFWLSVTLVVIGTVIESSAPEETLQTPLANQAPTDTATKIASNLNARDINIAKLYPDFDIMSSGFEVGYVNMDGFGTEEIIVSGPFLLDIFSFDAFQEWRRILHLTQIGGCGFDAGYACCELGFDFLNLYNDTARELAVYQRCGTGSFVSFEVYQYRGLSLAELIYTTEEPISRSLISVVNEKLYITPYLGHTVFHLVAENSNVLLEELIINFPSNTHKIHYWNGDTSIIVSEELEDIHVGEFLLFIHDYEKDLSPCTGIVLGSDRLSSTEHPHLLAATKSGETQITIACWKGKHDKVFSLTIQ